MLDVELLQRLPYSDHLLHLVKRCEEWLPRSLTGRAVLVGTVAGVAVYLVTKKRYKLPPGPRGWPLLGNILEFRETTIFDKLTEWQTKYGPIITLNLGPVSAVTLNRIDVVLEALVKRQADFAGRPQSYSSDLFSDGGRSISLGDYSPTWKLHRKLATKALKHYMTGNRLELALERSLSKGIQLLKEKKGPFNPHAIISLIVFNIINNICYNETCEINDTYFKRMANVLDTASNGVGNGFLEDIFPPLRLCPTKKMRVMIQLVEDFFGCQREGLRKHKQTLSQGTIRDFCDALLVAQEEAREEEDPALMAQMSDRHIIQTLGDIFAAGMDTSRFTLLWTLLYLAMHPDTQAKVHQEIDKALGARLFPKVSDRSSLPFTEAVLHESMRLNTVVPLGVPHTTLCDTHIGNYEIPKGTMVLINHYALHHDPEQWRDPEVFRPERFLDQTGKMAPKPESWLPFSAGRRVCLGESVAKPELHLLLAGIMRHFKISLPPGTKLNFEQRGGSFVNIPNDYEITVEARM
ncbi:steroid 17-alpha-hydroxylase/17,20 lyase-like [Haliotis rubra]|uniref:steroid 17-alpha-hydroxylase/17,20 lyase-like n=1 Tax=Haliotis rubra TaxID=36100 RepID=UPI001EE5DFE0|nr:steroid 17-alpha-hydroxylase/17,20 lyase-like [Haliotis rubra]XP_046554025.1 steroid 17-alpha-hydroxylase/17,20 lyase-like [Haliotis rubra]XP_046554027.1 steroid 17-alpha-hydroxylase/17,20 lyase-like [Haliotis rubra]XP_046554028.1 steroid 17-alpha-hydroxylase/17,20 lyase-like [Haliotis rubra]